MTNTGYYWLDISECYFLDDDKEYDEFLEKYGSFEVPIEIEYGCDQDGYYLDYITLEKNYGKFHDEIKLYLLAKEQELSENYFEKLKSIQHEAYAEYWEWRD
jgi:hypothetical protein